MCGVSSCSGWYVCVMVAMCELSCCVCIVVVVLFGLVLVVFVCGLVCFFVCVL